MKKIEKIEIPLFGETIPTVMDLIRKINEIIDVLNEMQEPQNHKCTEVEKERERLKKLYLQGGDPWKVINDLMPIKGFPLSRPVGSVSPSGYAKDKHGDTDVPNSDTWCSMKDCEMRRSQHVFSHPLCTYHIPLENPVAEKWKPDEGHVYFMPSFIQPMNGDNWHNTGFDNWRYDNSLVFETAKEAIEASNIAIEAIKSWREQEGK